MKTLEQWQEAVASHHPTAVFLFGSPQTLDEDSWTALIGPDTQADVVGTYNADAGLCWYSDATGEQHEGD